MMMTLHLILFVLPDDVQGHCELLMHDLNVMSFRLHGSVIAIIVLVFVNRHQITHLDDKRQCN